MVNGDALNDLALKISLDKLVKYEGRRKQQHTHRSMYGDAMEALVGAYYLDFGFAACQKFVTNRLLKPHYNLEELVESETNHKSRLIEWSQKNGYKISFDIVKEAGRSHTREFTAQVTLEGLSLATGTGFSKKKAEQSAALKAYDKVNEGRLPEGLKRKGTLTPIQRLDDSEGSNFRDNRPERPERGERHDRGDRRHARDDRQRDRDDRPRDERNDRSREERGPREDRPERGERREGRPEGGRPERMERQDRPERQDRGDRPDRPDRGERQDRPERTDRTERGDRNQNRVEGEGRPERTERTDRPERSNEPRGDRPEREPREQREPRGEQQSRRHGRYSVSNQDQQRQPEENLNVDSDSEFEVIVPEVSDAAMPMEPTTESTETTDAPSERRPDNRRGGRNERGPRGDRPERGDRDNRGDRNRRGPRVEGDQAAGPIEETKMEERDMESIGSMPDLATEPIAGSASTYDDGAPIQPEIKVTETYFANLPPLPEPKRKWVNVTKGENSAKTEPEPESEEAAPASDSAREESPSLANWDAEFAQVAPATEPLPETKNESSDAPKTDANSSKGNPDWVNQAAEEFKNDVLKAEEDFKAAKDDISLKPDDPAAEPGNDPAK